MAVKSRYKSFTATVAHPTGEWVEYYFRTSGDVVENGVIGAHNYITAGEYVSASLAALDTAVKAAYDHVPANVLTTDSTLNSAKLSGLIPNACLPDYIFGQLVYGGSLGANALAGLTNNAKSKLGTTSNTITLTDNTTSITGYEDNEGIYYIVAVAQTFAGISFNVGDWLVSNGAGWTKIDNTDAIAMWCGLTGNITTAQAKNVLGGSIANADDGFVTGDAVYNHLISDSPSFYNEANLVPYGFGNGSSIKFGFDNGGAVSYDAFIDTDERTSGNGQSLLLHAANGIGISANEGTNGNHTVWFVTDEMTSDLILSFPSSGGEILTDGNGYIKGSDIDILSDVDNSNYVSINFNDDESGHPEEVASMSVSYCTFSGDTTHYLDGNGGSKGLKIYSDERLLFLQIENGNRTGKVAALCTGGLTANRIFDFPDDSGTFALTKNVPTIISSNSAPNSPKAGDIWIDTSN